MKKRHWAVKRPHGMVLLREEGLNLASVHDRDEYTPADAALTVEWLNGHDQPLAAQVDRATDPNDPHRRSPLWPQQYGRARRGRC